MKIELGLLAALVCSTYFAVQVAHAEVSGYDLQFVASASNANMLAILSSNLAIAKSRNRDVVNFAERMADRHTRAAKWLENAAGQSLTTAALAAELDGNHQKIMTELILAKPGPDFDQRYIRAQKDGHMEAIVLLHNYAHDGQDKALKTFAQRALPSLKRHHALIDDIQSEGGVYVTQREDR
ncbi:MAG: putative membrane protein [Alphaproteobacteria bacterium]|nr:putative membrane protein [Alphaproteobacteria bacterium]